MKRKIHTSLALFVVLVAASLAGWVVLRLGQGMIESESSAFHEAVQTKSQGESVSQADPSEYMDESLGLKLKTRDGSALVATTCPYINRQKPYEPESFTVLSDKAVTCPNGENKDGWDYFSRQGAKTVLYGYDLKVCEGKKFDPIHESGCKKYSEASIGDHEFVDPMDGNSDFGMGYWLKTKSERIVSIEDYDVHGELREPHQRYGVFVPQE